MTPLAIQLVSSKEVIAALGISKATFHRERLRDPTFPRGMKIGRHLKFDVADFTRYINGKKKEGANG